MTGAGIGTGISWAGLLRYRISRQLVRLARLPNLRRGPCGNLRCNDPSGIERGGNACCFFIPETELELTVTASRDSIQNHPGDDGADRQKQKTSPFADTYRTRRLGRQIEAAGRD